MITQTTPSITDATEYKEAHGSIPGGSIIRTTDQRLMVVERSNGYVISGMEQGKTGIAANMVIDLRNTSATIVTVTTFVDDTPAPVEVKPAPVRVRIYVTFFGKPRFPVKIVENGNMRTVFESDDLALSQQWIKDNGYTEAYAPYYSPEVATKVSSYRPVVKPTTSPALVEIGERVIAITPMELPARIVTAGNCQYRITHHGAIISVEVLNPLSGSWHNAGNYATEGQVSNFLIRKSAPAIAVKPATYSPCALTIQWQTIPLLPAPVVKPEAPRPADVRVSYKCQDITAVYGVAGADTWTVYSDGPIVRKGVYTRFHSAESAIAAAKATIDTKAAAGIKKGMRGL